MRRNDQPDNWTTRIGEMEIIDPQTNEKYILVVGYFDHHLFAKYINDLYIRLYKENDTQINGDWLCHVNYVKWGLSKEMDALIKMEAKRLQKLEIFA